MRADTFRRRPTGRLDAGEPDVRDDGEDLSEAEQDEKDAEDFACAAAGGAARHER